MNRRFGVWLLLCIGLLLQARAQADLRAPFYKAERQGQVVYVLRTLHVGSAGPGARRLETLGAARALSCSLSAAGRPRARAAAA